MERWWVLERLLLPFFAAMPTWLLVGVTLGQARHSRTTRAFLALAVALGLWPLCELWAAVATPPLSRWVSFCIDCAWVSIGFLLLNFVYAAIDRARDRIWWSFAGVLGASLAINVLLHVVGARGFIDAPVTRLGFLWVRWHIDQSRGFWFYVLALATTSAVAVSLAMLWHGARRAEASATRSVLRGLGVGAAFSAVMVWLLELLLPLIFDLALQRYATSALVVFVYVVFRAERRFNFFEVGVEQFAAEIFNDFHEGIVLTDATGVVTDINPAGVRILGLPMPQVLGMSVAALAGGSGLGRGAERAEIVVPQGSDVRVLAATQSSVRRRGQEIGRIIVLRDVSDQKKTERLMTRSRDELAQEVMDRTALVQQTQKMEALGTMAGGVAHDFNNFLTAIIGYTTLAHETLAAGDPLQRDLAEIMLAAERAEALVKKILTFGRRDDLKFEPILIQPVIEEATAILRGTLPGTIRIDTALEAPRARVMGAANLLSLVLVNLGTNAQRAMPKGGVLHVRLEEREVSEGGHEIALGLMPGRYAVLVVEDEGCGIREENLHRLFDPFFSDWPDAKGTGLGLSVAYGIVRSHGGRVQVESTLGQGARFEIYLPQCPPSVASAKP